MSATATRTLLFGLFVTSLLIGQGQSIRPLTSIKKWFRVACIAEHLKDSDHYICDSHGYIHCLPGWSNEYEECKVPVCTQNCSQHGNCSAPNTCTCDVGWSGADCSKCVCLPGCVNGRCELPFECICDEGFEGMLCDKPKCKEGCAHGHCTSPGECICHPGWTGELCDECIKLPGCSRHGHCTKPLECTCDDGYQGNFCSKPICREGCHPQYGFCDRPNECWCKPGWTGQNCTECLTYPGCRNGGCDQPWECNCNPGFHGKLCDLEGDEVTTLPPFKKKYKEGKPRGRSALPANNFGGNGFFDIGSDAPFDTRRKQKRQNDLVVTETVTKPATTRAPELSVIPEDPVIVIDDLPKTTTEESIETSSTSEIVQVTAK